MSTTPILIEFYKRDKTCFKRVGNADDDLAIYFRHVERNCFSNCIMNLQSFEKLAGCTLELIAGSCGLCTPDPVWYEWGGLGSTRHVTVADFVKKNVVPGMTEMHFWFEDADGRVWDILDPYLVTVVVPAHRKRIATSAFWHGWLIPGVDRNTLREGGLLYEPADALVQDVLVKRAGQKIVLVELKD